MCSYPSRKRARGPPKKPAAIRDPVSPRFYTRPRMARQIQPCLRYKFDVEGLRWRSLKRRKFWTPTTRGYGERSL